MYVYVRSEPQLWTVGFYAPDGKWKPESDHNDQEEAAKRVAWLNGSCPNESLSIIEEVVELLEEEDGVPNLEWIKNRLKIALSH